MLVNGSPTEQFNFHRGLIQGDHLSPYFLNIVGEVFHSLMEKANEIGLIEEIYMCSNITNFSHLQFADDTIIFIKPGLENITNLKLIL